MYLSIYHKANSHDIRAAVTFTSSELSSALK